MDKKYKILLLLVLGLVILYLIWRLFLRRNNPKGNSSLDDVFLRRNNPKGNSSLDDVFFGIEKYETPKEYQILHNLAKNNTPEPLDLGIKEYKREPVPKKLYRTWCTSDPEGICGGRKADIDVLNSTQKAIPDWEQIIYGDKEIDNFLEKEFGKDHKVTKAYNLINPKYGAARADLFRYLIIYKYGGLYLDMKSCVSGPIPEMPKDKDMWISEWHVNVQGPNQHLFHETGEYQNWYIYARKGCPLLKEIIERVVHNIYKLHENPNNIINISESLSKNLGGTETKSKGNVLCTTGPIAMTIAILNSNQINNVQVDTSINNVLDYYCIKDDYIVTKDHYSQQTEPLIFPKKDSNHIPKVVYMTYHDIDSIPQYVFHNINKYCSGYEVKIYNDNMCLEFLEKYYGKEAVEIFNNMEIGAHKADFWRYCILYVFGGYYFDIKTDFQTHINNIFDSKKEKTWYTVICADNSCVYNGIIVTPPHNPVILDAIKHIYNNPKPSYYFNYVRELLNIVNKNCKNKVEVGENKQKNDWQCILFQEKCDGNCGNNCDRWGLDCIIVDKEGKKFFNTRYKDFGSWGKQKVENYIQTEKTKDLKTIQEKYNYNIIKNGYIPNIIWQTFYKTKVNEPVFELTNNTMLLNPEFNYKIITDLDIVQIIKDNFSDDILNAFLKLNIGAAKGDFTRYILMYLYGGIYLDLDSSISKPISDFIFEHKEYDNILFIDTHYNFEQWILIAKPRNILLKYTIDEMVRRIMNNVDNIFLVTGPTLFNDVIYYMITGNNIFDSNTKVNLTNRKKIFLQDDILSNYGLKVKVITDAPKYGFNFQVEIEGGIYDDPNIKKYIPTWGTKTPNLYKNNTKEEYSPGNNTNFNTKRIGNLVDAWFAGSLGSKERIKEFINIKKECPVGSFGSFLNIEPRNIIAPNLTDDIIHAYVSNSEKFWATYDYNNILLVYKDFSNSLRREIDNFVNSNKINIPKYDVVIHYRIGDFIREGKMIDPQSIINVFKSLKISPKATVCILDGGMNYGDLNEDEIKKSNFLKNIIRTEISKTHQIYNISNDIDIDYFLCSYAPILITGPGSFAITAAIANQHGIIRTPSCKNTNFCEKEGKSVQKIIHKNWVTYDYTLLDKIIIKEDYSPSRAQFGQDLLALEHHNHKRNGTYLEIGVHDGENANNTVMMDQEYGWSGVCIDPFMDNMENRSCQKFYVALGSEPGEAEFRYGENGEHSVFAGLDKFATTDDNKMHKDTVGHFEMKKVPVCTPEDVFAEANLPSTIDYMSLDVEGAEMDILRSFPFDKYCVKYATIETNNDKEKEKEMEEFMTQRGYKFEGHKEVDHIFSNSC
jgi:FkbM family methyltransferase